MRVKAIALVTALALVPSVLLAACGGTLPASSQSETVPAPVPPAKVAAKMDLPPLSTVESAYVAYMEQALNISPKKVKLNEAPAGFTGFQQYFASPTTAQGDIYSSSPTNWIYSASYLPVAAIYQVDPNLVVSIQLAAKSDYQSILQEKGSLSQIRKSPIIYFDFGYSKNYKTIGYLIWWEQ